MEERGLQGMKPYLEKLTLGVTRLLETSPGVTEVMFVEKEPAERHAILSWEQKNACVLPEDLKNFYLMTDGFRMTWNVKFDGNKEQPKRPHLGARCLIFELDSCAGNGKVCLVYKNNPPFPSPASEIWFLDRALYWHFLANSFTAYYRLMITHLGLPQWQYIFTGYGLSPQAKQWFNMYKPITVNTEQLWEADDGSFVNKLDPNKVFRSKNKASLVKKRPPTQAAASQKNPAAGGSPRTTSQGGSLSKRRETQP